MRRRLLLGVVLVVAVAACAGRVYADRTHQPTVPLAQTLPLATLTCSTPSAQGRLPTDVRWIGVAICPIQTVLDSPGMTPSPDPVRRPVVRRTDVRRLVSLLDRPDAKRTDQTCTMDLVMGPAFWVLDDRGRAWSPRLPLDECGQPNIAVWRALPTVH